MDQFRYNLNSNTISDDDEDDANNEFSGILEIYVHNARNIHNICIYENQDVYAKFSLTCDPDETLSTRIVNGGGKNPDFNENLRMKITHPEAVLKCEIWMLSRARNYLEDQLLGFALVPVSQVAAKPNKLTQQNYTLSSTDLFHSPAGTVQLTLSLSSNASPSLELSPASSSITSEITTNLDPIEYSRIEFPDIGAVRENHQMVSEYFSMSNKAGLSSNSGSGSGSGSGSFLRLGACDYEMTANSFEENSSLTDDRNSADSIEKSCVVRESSDTPTSKKGIEARVEKDSKNDSNNNNNKNSNKSKDLFGSINTEAEQSAMQQQIVDMYMRSMQQFTESLAKMKLPMELNKPDTQQDSSNKDITNNNNNNNSNKLEIEKKKDGSRVFYGSRAFF